MSDSSGSQTPFMPVNTLGSPVSSNPSDPNMSGMYGANPIMAQGSGSPNPGTPGYNLFMPGIDSGLQGILPTASGNAQNLYTNQNNENTALENQNVDSVTDLLNNYNSSFMKSLGPTGSLGQQLSGEFANYGITPNSGAFQSALGNQLGTLGAQNELTLGQSALQPGINNSYANLNQLGATQSGINNQAAQYPFQNAQMQSQQGLATNLASQQAAAQQAAAKSGEQGQIAGDAAIAGAMLL